MAYSPLVGFMTGYANLLPRWDESSTLVNFSQATFGGTISATAAPVPGPASTAALALGAIGVLRRRRRA